MMKHKKWWIMPPLIIIILWLIFALITSGPDFHIFPPTVAGY